MWLRFQPCGGIVRWINLDQVSEVYIHLDPGDPYISLYHGDSDEPFLSISKYPGDCVMILDDQEAMAKLREDVESVPLYSTEDRSKKSVADVLLEGPAG
jgi:hypothetical protein